MKNGHIQVFLNWPNYTTRDYSRSANGRMVLHHKTQKCVLTSGNPHLFNNATIVSVVVKLVFSDSNANCADVQTKRSIFV